MKLTFMNRYERRAHFMTKDNLQAVCFANRIYWTLPLPAFFITISTEWKLQYQFNEHIFLAQM